MKKSNLIQSRTLARGNHCSECEGVETRVTGEAESDEPKDGGKRLAEFGY